MWWGALLSAFLSIVGTFVGKALISLGIGYFVYTGIDTSLGFVKTQIFASLGGLSPTTLQVIGVLQVGTAINILVSSLVVRLTLKGLTAGAIKRVGLK